MRDHVMPPGIEPLAKKFEDHARLFGAEFVTANVHRVTRLEDGTFETAGTRPATGR